MNSLVVNDSFIEECKSLLIEGEFSSRWLLVETYYTLGGMILAECKGDITEFTATLAVKLGRSERFLWYCVKFNKMFPELNSLPEGKNINWNKIIHKYLTNGQKKEKRLTQCPKCGYEW